MLKSLPCFIFHPISMSCIHGGTGGLARWHAHARPGRMKVMTESTWAYRASYIMSTLESMMFADPLIRDRVLRGHSHQSIAQELQQQCPSLSRGLSTRSVRRFRSTNGIHRSSRLSAHEVDRVVEQYVV